MTDDLVKRLRENWTPLHGGCVGTMFDGADRIIKLETALRSIAEVPISAEIPDRTTIWGLATYMQETAKDALEEGKQVLNA